MMHRDQAGQPVDHDLDMLAFPGEANPAAGRALERVHALRQGDALARRGKPSSAGIRVQARREDVAQPRKEIR